MVDRGAGVRTTKPVERAPAHIPPLSVLNVAPLEQFVVRYVDGDGNIKTTIVVKLGETYYEPANAQTWSDSCRPVNDWLGKILLARDGAKGAVPKDDGVDVMGGPG